MRKIIILGIILFNIMGFASFSVEGGSFYCLKIKDVAENEKNETEVFFHNLKSHTRTKQGINFSFMETVDQFFDNKDYENLLYYFDYKAFLSDYNDIYEE